MKFSKLVGMGFDGTATFSDDKTGIHRRLKKKSYHALFVHCHCHRLQLACVQAANHTTGLKHMYTTLSTLWKFFHYCPKRAECLKEVKRVLDLPELKIIRPSETCWLAHERCVKAVEASYSTIVMALNNIYETTHEPEALGISKALCKKLTVAAIFLLDYTLPHVAKLSKTMQAENLDLTAIADLVDATLHVLDDAMLPATNWVLEFLDEREALVAVTDTTVTMEDISYFQERVAKPFVSDLKSNISSRFASQYVVSCFSILKPKKVPSLDSSDLSCYGEDALKILLDHYGVDKPAETVLGVEVCTPVLISCEIHTEWNTFHHILAKKPKDYMKTQLKELATNEMLETMFPNLNRLAKICLSIPVGTALVERSFSQMKKIKTRLRNHIGESSLSSLMKIAIESPENSQIMI